MKTDNILIHPSRLEGEIDAISSKSYGHRALILAGLCENPTNIYINEFSKDINVTIDALINLGVGIEKFKNFVKVTPPKVKIEKATIDVRVGIFTKVFYSCSKSFCQRSKNYWKGKIKSKTKL